MKTIVINQSEPDVSKAVWFFLIFVSEPLESTSGCSGISQDDVLAADVLVVLVIINKPLMWRDASTLFAEATGD